MNAPDLSDRLADLRAEFAERGITPTPLAVIAHAFDAGLDETTTVARRDDPTTRMPAGGSRTARK